MGYLVFQIILCVTCFGVFAWAAHMHIKQAKARAKEKRASKPTEKGNVIDFSALKVRRCEDNLKLFLEADEALTKDQTERFFALYMKAIESTKKSLREQQKAGIRRVS